MGCQNPSPLHGEDWARSGWAFGCCLKAMNVKRTASRTAEQSTSVFQRWVDVWRAGEELEGVENEERELIGAVLLASYEVRQA
jgi:hypothetical protein